MSRPSSSRKHRICLIGAGKIARDQHVPMLTAAADFDLVAVADSTRTLDGVPSYRTLASVLAAHPDIDAVAICTPPQIRHALACEALQAGLHVLLEKPPCATVMQAEQLRALALHSGRTLFAAWHSRFAPGVAPAAAWLSRRTVSRVTVTWAEDVRRWHPGQDWLWRPGGMGVFDPGINALSIATHILPPIWLHAAHLKTPEARQAPIAARLEGVCGAAGVLRADFDFLSPGAPVWNIAIETHGDARLLLSDGGHALHIDDAAVALEPVREYAAVYAHFAGLIAAGAQDADLRPLQLAADAFAIATHETVAPFHDDPSLCSHEVYP